MNWVRDFTVKEGHNPLVRNIEDAPAPMRQEFIDLVFGILVNSTPLLSRNSVFTESLAKALASAQPGNLTVVLAMLRGVI